MSESLPPIQTLKDNYDVNFWSDLLDQQEYRLTELHKQIDWEQYMEWGLTALKAQKNDKTAKSMLPNILNSKSDTKKIIDEMALIYLIQPLIRHFLFRATNQSKEINNAPPNEN